MELEVSSAEQSVPSVVESVETVEVVSASEDMDPDSAGHHGLGMDHQIMVSKLVRCMKIMLERLKGEDGVHQAVINCVHTSYIRVQSQKFSSN